MTLFSLFQLVEGGKLIISYAECNWIILLKMITAVANYICMMDLQHYWIFGQICRQIIVLTPEWCIQGFVNVGVSDAMKMHNETWTKSKMNAYHLVFLFFLYQIKLVFFHQLIKTLLTRWEIQLKEMLEKPKHCWQEIWNHHFRKRNYFLSFIFASEIQATEVRFENMWKNMLFHGLNSGI